MVTEKQLAYGSAGVGLFGALMALASGGGALSILAALLAGLGSIFAILFLKYGYILVPLLTQRTNTLLITDTGYEIPPSQDVIVKKVGNLYYSSAFLGIRVFESATEKSLEQNIAYNEDFERAISNIKYVAKVSYMLYAEDIGEERKKIETKKAEAQLRLAREREKTEPDVLRIDKYEREVAMWDEQLTKLTKGLRPMGVLAYAMTTASGVSKEAATAAVRAQARELKVTLSNALNVQVEQLAADQMLKCFEWEKAMPPTPRELEAALI
ncbi:MAG: hypothetical protein AB1657_03595 [Candidatus Micrarchaeota archaeon]